MRSRDIETKYDVMYVPIIYYDTKIHRFLRIRLGPLPSPLDVILTHLSLSQRGRSLYRLVGRRTGQCPQDWDNNVIHSRPDTRLVVSRLSTVNFSKPHNNTTTHLISSISTSNQNQVKYLLVESLGKKGNTSSSLIKSTKPQNESIRDIH